MSWESIGSISTGDMPNDEDWILLGLELAKKYIEYVCGRPPAGCKLDVMWHDHELGSYPSLGVWCENDTPWDYVDACERALEVFDEAVSWDRIKEYAEDETVSADNEEDDEHTEDEF